MSRPEYLVKEALDSGILLIVMGLAGALLSAFADSIGLGRPGLGLEQLSGLAIGVLVTMVGLGKVFFTDARFLFRIVTGIYMSGILYVGLRPNSFKFAQYKILLEAGSFYWRDFAINTIGFIPLGYLIMLSFENRRKDQRSNLFRRAIIVAGVGGLISLFLEVSQYYLISGRSSSLTDWIANTLGTLIGIAIYIFMEQGNALDKRIRGLQKPCDIS